MADEKVFITLAGTKVAADQKDHGGYKSLMRLFADKDFRAANKGETLTVTRAGKPFIKVMLDD